MSPSRDILARGRVWVERAVTAFLCGCMILLLLGLLSLGYLLWRAIGADPRKSGELTDPIRTGHGLASSSLDPMRSAAKPSHAIDLPWRTS